MKRSHRLVSTSSNVSRSVWEVEEIVNNNDENQNSDGTKRTRHDDDGNANKQPKKIDERRRSARIHEKHKKTIDNDRSSSSQDIQNLPDVGKCGTKRKKKKDSHMLMITRSQLSEDILANFDEFESSDPNDENCTTFTARCKHCEEKKSFVNGNNSNLKTHLKRVRFVKFQNIFFKYFVLI